MSSDNFFKWSGFVLGILCFINSSDLHAQSIVTPSSFTGYGYVQYDTAFGYAEKDFGIRRARLGAKGSPAQYVNYKFEVDYGSTTTTGLASAVVDAYLEVGILPGQKIRLGKGKTPIGLEFLQSSSEGLLPEGGMTNLLIPQYDTGMTYILKDETTHSEFNLGVFSGVADGTSQDNLDPNRARSVVARYFTHPVWEAHQRVGIGIAGNVEQKQGTPANVGAYSYRGLGSISSYSSTTFADGSAFHIFPQGYWYTGPFGVLGEYAISSQTLSQSGITAVIQNSAWQLAFQYSLTGEDAGYKNLTPKTSYEMGKGGGAWQLAFRVAELRLDEGAVGFAKDLAQVKKAFQIGAGVNWIWNENVKWTLGAETISRVTYSDSTASDTWALLRGQVQF